ncbi:MAG: phosphoenolpyruvate--protein phosphotransferase [Oscillospiraceae bacterium]|nr:phosphoenolpyruvate--protein phosphotransferase [Oscillospiraceae bacterium]
MKIIQGKGVSGGIAFGRIRLYRRADISVNQLRIDDPDEELRRFDAAKQQALQQLDRLYERALTEVGEENAQIFDVHRMLLDDPDYNDSVEGTIRSLFVNAEYAVSVASDDFSEMFAAMEDEYMRERSADVRDVSRRIMRCLLDLSEDADDDSCGGSVICADDLSPSETVQLGRETVLAFCTAQGSANSHTAILARTMNIPAVTGIGEEFFYLKGGEEVIVDGASGTLYIDPDLRTKKEMLRKRAAEMKRRESLMTLRGMDNVTKDGRRVNVLANVAGLQDVSAAIDNDCGGIGLFRSEFMYLESSDYPTEEYQFRIYKRVLESMKGKRVIIRTLDIAADKQTELFGSDRRDNPALGFRAIRVCLNRPDIFRTQLRALMRASVYGSLGIMFPMIISVEEIRETKALLAQVREELKAEGIPYRDDVEIGIMIETPAAVMISDLLAKEVDFFSIGSNDLTQYTLAADRLNPEFDSHSYVHHKALLRMIKMTADNAHKEGAWVGICGELGGDTTLTGLFIAMGVDEFSVSPSQILPLRERILGLDMSGGEKVLATTLNG